MKIPAWLLTTLLNWLWGKISELLILAKDKYDENAEAKETQEKNDLQAEKVKNTADQIREAAKNGTEVTEEMKQNLRQEARKLMDTK